MYSPRIIFFGTPDYAVPYLEALIDASMKPIAVISQPDKPAGRGKKIEPTPVKRVAQKNSVPAYQWETIRDIQAQETLRSLKPDIIIVVAFGQIIPNQILIIPPYGCVNVHPSLLPFYRGPSPIQETILRGDEKTGVTIMLMDEKMDHGPILALETISIDANETCTSLSQKTTAIGTHLLIKTLKEYIAGAIIPKAQDDARASYTRLLKKNSGHIDWSKSAIFIERMVRALNPWPGTWVLLREKRLKILRVSVFDPIYETPLARIGDIVVERQKLLAYCNPGILEFLEVQCEGKRVMPTKEFLRGSVKFFL